MSHPDRLGKYRITDVLTAFAKQAKPLDYLYKELQFGLRAAVGTRTLDELLEGNTGRGQCDGHAG